MKRRVAGVLAGVLVVLVATACVPGADTRSADTGAKWKLVPAPIDGVDIVVRESFPPGYTAQIRSGLPSGCASLDSAKVTGRSDNEVRVTVLNSVPADEDVACTAIYGTVESNVDLGTDFESGETYRVKVNGRETTFVAQ